MRLVVAAFAGLACPLLWAQGTGLINLMPPAVPGAAVSAPAASASSPAAKKGKAGSVPGADKTILNGTVSLVLTVGESNVQSVRVKFAKVFPKAERARALAAAVAVQRDVRISCGSLCEAARPAPPSIVEDGRVAFDMVISGLDRLLSSTDMLALLEARPLARTAAPASAAPQPKP